MPDRPFLVYHAPGATHAPHHVPPERSDRCAGRFDAGWGALREEMEFAYDGGAWRRSAQSRRITPTARKPTATTTPAPAPMSAPRPADPWARAPAIRPTTPKAATIARPVRRSFASRSATGPSSGPGPGAVNPAPGRTCSHPAEAWQ